MIPQTQQGKAAPTGPTTPQWRISPVADPVVGVKKRPRKRPGARGRPATKGSFKKGCAPGPGRPRGVPNKFTGDLKEAILAGVNGSNEQGVAGFVLDLALDTPTSAAALLGRLIPVSMVGTLDGTLLVRHVDETKD